jgi:hypothetical protein
MRQREGNWATSISASTRPGQRGQEAGAHGRGQPGRAAGGQGRADAGTEQTEGIANIVSVFQHAGKPPTDIVTSGGGAQAYWR